MSTTTHWHGFTVFGLLRVLDFGFPLSRLFPLQAQPLALMLLTRGESRLFMICIYHTDMIKISQ